MLFKKKEKLQEKVKLRRNPGKYLKNKKLLSLLCIVLAAILSFVVLPKLYEQQADTAMVVTVTDTIKKGEIIKANKVIEKKVGAYGLTAGVISNVAKLEGKVAKVDLLAGDYITDAKIGDFVSDPIIENIVKQGKQLTTITLQSNAAGLASHLQKGDIVNVGTVRETETGFHISFDPLLKGMQIYDIENADAVSVDDVKASKADAVDAIPQTITFIVTETQAARLLDAEYNGKIHITLIKR
ncbi:Flp pilus assembly protein CpaB [Sinanaerobacter sp. ZZT-01]|uniref:Flp pilus assembly protein CpaB n=1 Tax=Sinanaerobacter sp. ZZT-01 TaxID=3111540 RepID=UPI002D7805DC|nr:RcpC/CpaB family pilus assembly protein [Sinanaerobacter sp. ZZT-01]WRR94261.1 RcpC/CpaB family pilus assembly protein [Sinanaerobacter sp. ZZT-01]